MKMYVSDCLSWAYFHELDSSCCIIDEIKFRWSADEPGLGGFLKVAVASRLILPNQNEKG
jgi:hypothetical protein